MENKYKTICPQCSESRWLKNKPSGAPICMPCTTHNLKNVKICVVCADCGEEFTRKSAPSKKKVLRCEKCIRRVRNLRAKKASANRTLTKITCNICKKDRLVKAKPVRDICKDCNHIINVYGGVEKRRKTYPHYDFNDSKPRIKGKMQKYRKKCKSCDCDMGYHTIQHQESVCNSCASSRFRSKQNVNFDYDDWVMSEVKAKYSSYKLYKKRCPTCDCDMGYQRHSVVNNSNCLACSIKIRTKIPKGERQIRQKLQPSISRVARLHKAGKSTNYVSTLVDYSPQDLLHAIEKQFYSRSNGEAMSWSNYGKKGWHIDHVIPASWFRYTSPTCQAFIECWSLSNLQPMWREENTSKNNRYSGKFDISQASSSYYKAVDRLAKDLADEKE